MAPPPAYAAFVDAKRTEFVRELLLGKPQAVAMAATCAVAWLDGRLSADVALQSGLVLAALTALTVGVSLVV